MLLDELPEFGHTNLEALRQLIEDEVVTKCSTQGTVLYPVNFMLVGAMNPCPCGYFGDPLKECSSSPTQVSRYRKRISGPMMERSDIFVEVPRVDYEKRPAPSNGESSADVWRRVQAARDIQQHSFSDTAILNDAEMGPNEVDQLCEVEDSVQSLIQAIVQQMQLSDRDGVEFIVTHAYIQIHPIACPRNLCYAITHVLCLFKTAILDGTRNNIWVNLQMTLLTPTFLIEEVAIKIPISLPPRRPQRTAQG